MNGRILFFLFLLLLTVAAVTDIWSGGVRNIFSPFETIITAPLNGDLEELDEYWFETWDTFTPSPHDGE